MKTVITKKIDGFEIVTGFDRPVVDPMETKKVTEQKLNEHPLIAKIDKALDEINATRPESAKLQELYANFKRLLVELEGHRKEIFETNLVYFEPKRGETIISDADAVKLKVKFEDLENAKLTKDGQIISDFRKSQYWLKGDKWGHKTVEKLGEKIPSKGIHNDDLRESQKAEIAQEKEDDRFSKLTPEAKENEKLQRLEGALTEAAIMKSKLEISDDHDALTKSKAWYAAKKQEIQDKYK